MALVYPEASIDPTKERLLEDWVPAQPWGAAGLTRVGAYRLDDPAGDVGIETFLLADGDGVVRQVPLTYRPAPVGGVEPIATMEHSVLGRRWVYDAMVDHDAVAAFVETAVNGGQQADVEYDDAEGHHVREATTLVRGSGRERVALVSVGALSTVSDQHSTTVTSGDLELVLARVVPLAPATGGLTITGTWPGQDEPALLAAVLGW